MSQQTYNKDECDKYGPMKFEVNHFLLRLPRSCISTTRYTTSQFVFMHEYKQQGYSSISPQINTNTFSKTETDTVIKNYIWNPLFSLKKTYTYDNDKHYPAVFMCYLKSRLGLKNIDSEKELEQFITLIRNEVFKRVVYTIKPGLLTAATKVGKNTIRFNNPCTYEIKERWRHWLHG